MKIGFEGCVFDSDARKVSRNGRGGVPFRLERDAAYHGRIASKISEPDLKSAIDALLEGRPIHPAETKAFGCAIPRH